MMPTMLMYGVEVALALATFFEATLALARVM
jgi:hypothetical protein